MRATATEYKRWKKESPGEEDSIENISTTVKENENVKRS
jgi:hypothetical protein